MSDAAKAANWFADCVREKNNPMFFAEKGRFMVTNGPFMDFSWRTELLQYTEDEKNKLPNQLIGK